MDFLAEIIGKKRVRLLETKRALGHQADATVSWQALSMRDKKRRQAFRAAIRNQMRFNVIAEIKRASPSKGVIRDAANPAALARAYRENGAAAISVLTEEDYFQGSLDDLRAVRAAVRLPVLRKDFIFEDFQVYESAAAGADALLLIVAALEDDQLLRLRALTEDVLRMDALVEVHTQTEMERALKCGATLIGVNNRDLRSFNTSLETSVQLARYASDRITLISESGLQNGSDLSRLRALGYDAFLIGETLLRANKPGMALRALIEEAEGHSTNGQGEQFSETVPVL